MAITVAVGIRALAVAVGFDAFAVAAGIEALEMLEATTFSYLFHIAPTTGL